jgi:hypothetical protein
VNDCPSTADGAAGADDSGGASRFVVALAALDHVAADDDAYRVLDIRQIGIEPVTVTLADGNVLPNCRPDLLNIGDLLARNWSIFPLKPRSKLPAVRSWLEYQRRHLNFDELEQWFSTPDYNVAVVTGRISGIFVVDLDSPAAIAWATEHLPPYDLRVRTARGLHCYYPYSGARPMRNKTRIQWQGETLELDIRAEGGYVVGPGSVHESGHVYTREGAGWAW